MECHKHSLFITESMTKGGQHTDNCPILLKRGTDSAAGHRSNQKKEGTNCAFFFFFFWRVTQ